MSSDYDAKLRALITQSDPFSDEQLTELRKSAASIGNLGTDWRDRAQFRAAIETIAAIRQFDIASAKLIETTNKLTRLVLLLTFIAVLFAGISLYLSWLGLKK